MTLGENLKRLRIERGLSQEEVAQKLFVSRQSVSKWENDVAEPGVENLKALARLYGVTVDVLVGAEGADGSAGPEQAAAQKKGSRDLDLYIMVLLGRAALVVFFGALFWSKYTVVVFPFDLAVMIAGIWVRHPAVRVVILVLEGLSLAMGVMVLVVGNIPVSLIICAISGSYLYLMTRPVFYDYFHPQEGSIH